MARARIVGLTALLLVVPIAAACDKDKPSRHDGSEDDEADERADSSAKAKGDGAISGKLNEAFEAKKIEIERLASRLAERFEVTAVVDPDVHSFVDCRELTVIAPRGSTNAELLKASREAIEPLGLDLQLDGKILKVVVRAGTEVEGCYDPKRPRSSKRPAEPKPEEEAAPAESESAVEGVTQVGPNSFTIRREVFDEVRSGTALKGVKLRPAGGDGVRIGGIRSKYGGLGFQNGDLVRSVNGRSLDDPETAFDAFAEERAKDEFDFEIERRGETIHVTYRIVP